MNTAAPPPIERAGLPLALYLHFPWCVRKCPYCDFNSHPLGDGLPEDAYVDALLRDLAFELQQDPEQRPLTSIFMGGGTPSLFSGRSIARVLEGVAQRLGFAPDIEITLEANPGTVDAAHFRDYRAAGVNRLSIGVQSLNDVQLKRLGRVHDRSAAIDAVRVARASGFANLNLDLMFALPRQTPDEAAADLTAALALEPEHLSYYQLTLEPNTAFAAAPPPLPDDEAAWTMQEQAVAQLSAAGFARYEVSAYARAGRQSRHNLNYWTFGDYLGLGAGAHAKRSGAGGVQRRARHKHPRRYQADAGSPASLQEDVQVAAPDLPFEYAMNALRLDAGFTLAQFTRRTGLAPATLQHALQEGQRRGLLQHDGARVATTELGARHLNAVLTLFLP